MADQILETSPVSPLSVDEYAAILRQDFASFVQRTFCELNPGEELTWGSHLEVLTSALADAAAGKIRRLIITLPPRQLKSICASVAFPAWVLGRKPNAKILCVSYGKELAEDLARKSLATLSSPWYQMAFPARLSANRRAAHDFWTTKLGQRRATSIEGATTGFGADFIIIDDPLKPGEAPSDTQRRSVNTWFDETLYSRLNNKAEGCIIIAMQRLHEDDLVGHVTRHGQNWTVVNFPAIAEADESFFYRNAFGTGMLIRRQGSALHPSREPLSSLLETKAQIGSYLFSAQYQQRPAPADGGRVKIEWFKRYEERDLPRFDKIVQSWDTANTDGELNDYSVCTIWGVTERAAYLLHIFRERLLFPSLKRAVIAQEERFRVFGIPITVLIEENGSGKNLIDALRHERFSQVCPVRVTGSKQMRMDAQTAQIENGFVYVPREAHWLDEYFAELRAFPNGRHDDQVDSTSLALGWIAKEGRELNTSLYFKEPHEYGLQTNPAIICLKPSGPCGFTVRGQQVFPDSDGIYRIPREDAPFPLPFGWTVVG